MTDDLRRSHPPTTSPSTPNPAHTRHLTCGFTMHTADWELVPGAGVGPLRFGMSPAEVADELRASEPQKRVGGSYGQVVEAAGGRAWAAGEAERRVRVAIDPWSFPTFDSRGIEGEDVRAAAVEQLAAVYWINRPARRLPESQSSGVTPAPGRHGRSGCVAAYW